MNEPVRDRCVKQVGREDYIFQTGVSHTDKPNRVSGEQNNMFSPLTLSW